MTELILIGTRIGTRYHPEWEGQPLYFELEKHGVTPILGKSRSGKTTITKTIACAVAESHAILIILPFNDGRNDWYGLRYMNEDHPEPQNISDLFILNNLAMRISSFSESWDWHALGITSTGASTMARLATKINVHHDDPDIFRNMLHDLPTNAKKEAALFQSRWGFSQEPLHPQTKDNMNRQFQIAHEHLHLFWTPTSGKIFVPDYGREFLRHPHLFIDLEDGAHGKLKSKAFCGIIFRQISPYLYRLKPIIFIEEADAIAEETKEAIKGDIPGSLYYLRQFIHKLQRDDINIFMLTQSPQFFDKGVAAGYQSVISGKLAREVLPWGPISIQDNDMLRNNKRLGIRHFHYYTDDGQKYRFRPVPLPCMYEVHQKLRIIPPPQQQKSAGGKATAHPPTRPTRPT